MSANVLKETKGQGLWLFLWVRGCMMRAAFLSLIHSPLKLVVIVSTWTTLLLGAYLLTHQGLQFVYETAGVGPFLLDRLWYLFVFVISIMLMVSQFTTAYSTMVRSGESAFWMSLPVSARWVLRAKWLESSCYSAWAVMLLVMPLGLAYLVILEKPLWLVGWLLGILLPLVGIVTALSTTILLVWLRWGGARLFVRRELYPLGFLGLCLVLFWLLGERSQDKQQDVWFVALQEFLPRMQVATSTWLPSSWMARALGAGLNQRWVEAGLFFALLWTTFLASLRVLDHVAARLLVPVFWRQADRVDRVARVPLAPLPATRSAGQAGTRLGVRWWWGEPFLACVVKDVLLLLRDPSQWSQGLVFFGLLGAYFANIHRVAQMAVEPSWRIGVASLNLACTLLVFGSLAVRFLFPQMSLEGRRLWLIHVVPGGLRQLFYSKLLFYGVLALVLVEGLLMLSATRLRLPLPIGWWLAVVGVLASVSLVGLTLGLGARFIDPAASDPARFVSSSNGALALVLMLVYVGGVAWTLVIAWTSWMKQEPLGFLIASLWLFMVSGLLGFLPVRQGMRAIDRLEL